ncbi:MAG: hypothetical protein ACP5RV_11960, partial [Thiomonas sp.]
SLASNTMRTARSMTSGEYFGDFLIMAPSSQSKEPPQKPGRFRETTWQHLQEGFDAPFVAP